MRLRDSDLGIRKIEIQLQIACLLTGWNTLVISGNLLFQPNDESLKASCFYLVCIFPGFQWLFSWSFLMNPQNTIEISCSVDSSVTRKPRKGKPIFIQPLLGHDIRFPAEWLLDQQMMECLSGPWILWHSNNLLSAGPSRNLLSRPLPSRPTVH